MRKLERKIIQNIYLLETKQTLFRLVFRIVAVVGFALGGIILISMIINQLVEQQTFDILEIVFEDADVIKNYFIEAIQTFIVELPKMQIFLSTFAFVLSFLLLYVLIKNFSKYRNKIKSLIKYWLVH